MQTRTAATKERKRRLRIAAGLSLPSGSFSEPFSFLESPPGRRECSQVDVDVSDNVTATNYTP